jgi:crotonobetainyl-CoA:carnitine CoA-transferase CaiB-like acyl-CoA transferase
MEAEGQPTGSGVPVVDMVSGLNSAIGIMLALQARKRSIRGQFVDIALFDCGISVLHPHSVNSPASGQIPRRSGNAHPNICLYDTFSTSKGQIFLAIDNDGQFRKVCERLEAPTLAKEPRYVSNTDCLMNREALKRKLQALLAPHEAAPLAESSSARAYRVVP